MPLVNTVKKVITMDIWDIVRFQLMLHCYLQKIPITEQVLDCITLLAVNGEMELSAFCDDVASKQIFRNSQSVRTALGSIEKKGLVTTFKNGKSKKRIKMKSDILLEIEGNILLDLKVIKLETEKS